jgi:hypothetical protein
MKDPGCFWNITEFQGICTAEHGTLLNHGVPRMPTSKNQMERLILILEMIKTGQYPNSTDFLKRLMEKPAVSGTPMVPVSKHTVLRDIRDLRERFKAPIEYDPDRNGYVLMDPDWDLMKAFTSRGKKQSIPQGRQSESTFSREKALGVAIRLCYHELEEFHITDIKPAGIEATWKEEPCWYVFPPPNYSGGNGDSQQRMIVVSKKTGKVLYDGGVMGNRRKIKNRS